MPDLSPLSYQVLLIGIHFKHALINILKVHVFKLALSLDNIKIQIILKCQMHNIFYIL